MTRTILILALIVIGGAVVACSSSSRGLTIGPDPAPSVVQPGATLPTGTTVRVNTSGTYVLPAGATSLRTRCFGRVTVTIDRAPNPPEMNTCESVDGSANQTNGVAGVASVDIDLGPGAFAHLTVS